LDSSFTFILNEPYESLAFILADKGYDVWMGNNRGNRYSTDNVYFPNTSAEYWAFSFDQMGSHDFPTMINYVRNNTGYPKIVYIGHSQGTLQAFAGLIDNPSIANMLDIFIAFGPVTTVKYITNTFLKILADLRISDLFEFFGVKSFLDPFKGPLKYLFEIVCAEDPIICENVIEAICGPHKGAFNETRMPVVVAHEPGGTSVQNMAHWSQEVISGEFIHYDYGKDGNLKHYNQTTPPLYDYSKLPNLPIALFSGSEDELADPQDVSNLAKKIPNLVYWQILKQYAHLDFVWCITAYIDMYPNVLQLIQNYTSSN